MIFGSRLRSSFSMSALYSFLKYLSYTRNRKADKFEKYNSGLGFDRLGATHFQTLGEIATLVLVATHIMETTGLNAETCFNLQICIACFTSEVYSALRRRKTLFPPGWPENRVIIYCPDAQINTPGSTYSGELQTALLNRLCKTKKKVVVSLHNFLFILISRSLPSLKQKPTTAFRHKRIHNCITQPKASRSTRAANAGNVPQLRVIITSHTVCTFTIIYCTLHAAAQQL